jgi:SAM-dependent methyltransferase
MNDIEQSPLLSSVAAYYSAKLAAHGQSARGVDWNGEESQFLRFAQLDRIIDQPQCFSLNDLGCGYGALFEFLQARYSDFQYTGLDISADMIESARRCHGGHDNARYLLAARPGEIADYSVASGIFNVRVGRGDAEWRAYLEETLSDLDAASRRGFAFNCLSSYSDPDKMRADLYYADPCQLFDLCKRRYGRDVALLHDYGLYEFTILVRKKP